MNGEFIKAIEQIMLTAKAGHARVIGFLSPLPGSGVSLVSSEIAKSFTSSGLSPLHIDLSGPILQNSNYHTEQDHNITFSQHVRETEDGIKKLDFSQSGISPFIFYNNELMKDIIQNDLAAYTKIILELPPVLLKTENCLAPLAAAVLSDCLFLVCPTGQVSRNELKSVVKELKSANIRISGVVLNDFYFPHAMPEFLKNMDFYSNMIRKKVHHIKSLF